MKYDDASWHDEGMDGCPVGVAENAGATHIGIFLAWAITRDHAGQEHVEESPGEIAAVKERRMTGAQFLLKVCDGKLIDDDLDDQANGFARKYYSAAYLGEWSYVGDYEQILGEGLPTTYHVADTWENFDKIAPVIDRQFARWQAGRPFARRLPG